MAHCSLGREECGARTSQAAISSSSSVSPDAGDVRAAAPASMSRMTSIACLTAAGSSQLSNATKRSPTGIPEVLCVYVFGEIHGRCTQVVKATCLQHAHSNICMQYLAVGDAYQSGAACQQNRCAQPRACRPYRTRCHHREALILCRWTAMLMHQTLWMPRRRCSGVL